MVNRIYIYLMQINYNYYQKIPIKNKHKRYHYYKKEGKWKPKLKFETYKMAEKYLSKKDNSDEYNIYICPYCGKYHIGHYNKRE